MMMIFCGYGDKLSNELGMQFYSIVLAKTEWSVYFLNTAGHDHTT